MPECLLTKSWFQNSANRPVVRCGGRNDVSLLGRSIRRNVIRAGFIKSLITLTKPVGCVTRYAPSKRTLIGIPPAGNKLPTPQAPQTVGCVTRYAPSKRTLIGTPPVGNKLPTLRPPQTVGCVTRYAPSKRTLIGIPPVGNKLPTLRAPL